MSAKDKAKELINKFINIQDKIDWTENQDLLKKCEIQNESLGSEGEYYWHELAKQCALICIDEMLDFRNNLYMNEGSSAHQWLLDVKQEIEKL